MRNFNTEQTRANIRKIFESAHAEELATGLNWYYDAHQFAKYLAEKYIVPRGFEYEKALDMACGVIAVLSPSNYWEKNKQDAENFCKHHPAWNVKASTYGTNCVKAVLILDGDLSQVRGQKVTRFYQNIRYPDTATCVTVDRHALGVLLGYAPDKTEQRLTKVEYLSAEDAYRQVAKEYGIRVNQLQAVTWEVWRKRWAYQPSFDCLSIPF